MDNDFQAVVGHSFSFRSTPVSNWNGVIDSAVLVVEPNKKFSYSWGTMGWRASSFGRWSRRVAEHPCAWSILASAPIKTPLTRGRTTAGGISSVSWNKLWRSCNNYVSNGLSKRRLATSWIKASKITASNVQFSAGFTLSLVFRYSAISIARLTKFQITLP